MTQMYALVKYPVEAEPEIKLAAIRNGLREMAMMLVEDHNWTSEQVLFEYEKAAEDAQLAEQWTQRGFQ